jgi:hypothetical protein
MKKISALLTTLALALLGCSQEQVVKEVTLKNLTYPLNAGCEEFNSPLNNEFYEYTDITMRNSTDPDRKPEYYRAKYVWDWGDLTQTTVYGDASSPSWSSVRKSYLKVSETAIKTYRIIKLYKSYELTANSGVYVQKASKSCNIAVASVPPRPKKAEILGVKDVYTPQEKINLTVNIVLYAEKAEEQPFANYPSYDS